MWEYKVVEAKIRDEKIAEFNKLGAKGWECITVIALHHLTHEYLFKRKLGKLDIIKD